MRSFLLLFAAIASSVFAPAGARAARGTVIEDFESGPPLLTGYPGQDFEPDAWEWTASNPFGGTHALRLFGNTWKTEEILPVAIGDSTVWQVAAYVEQLGEMQAFGVSDSLHELLYTFAGEQLPQGSTWWTVYQGAMPAGEWYAYLLPIGRDWFATHGYLPTITRLIYVNDDDAEADVITLFDEIIDVTADLPVAPEVSILYTITATKRLGPRLFRVGVQFYANVFDPDSPSHTFLWDFGDDTTSAEQNPAHQFLVEADYTYTVGLLARDPDGLVGNDTCQVVVEPGEGTLPLTINFVGDVFTGRSYESPGGIIDTYGVEALFEPTLSIFGQAADVSVCNLECSYTDRGTPHPTKSVVFRSRPENIAGIEYAGVDVVTLGNNHIIDYGEEGLVQTTHLLDSIGVARSGAGTNAYFSLLPAFRSEKGVRVAFLGQCNRTGRQWNYQPFLDAGYNKPGFAYLLPQNIEQAIDEARAAADIVILQLHSGDEYETAPPAKGGGFSSPPPVEASRSGPNDPDFRFRVEPSPGDRALRRLAVDAGADIVINHHPHVLQGFESYNGKLIAHSLGNFVFDLYYPETMPTIVLALDVEKEGITGYAFTPAWIDDWIPRPATGRLGREIIDRLADYSRPMNALVAARPDGNGARVFLDRGMVDSTVSLHTASDSLYAEQSSWITPPLAISTGANLSRILSVTGSGTAPEIRWGREILWHGGFEPEGATFWDDNTEDEWLDTTEARTGLRSLALRRTENDGEAVGTDLEKHLPCDVEKEHSVVGYVKGENAAGAVLMARFYNSRYAQNPVQSSDAGTPLSGTFAWTGLWKNLDTPADGSYFELRCSSDPPASGTGRAWFDDLALVEWEPWTGAATPVPVPSPNNLRYLQVRGGAGPSAVTVSYEETAYDRIATALAGEPPAAAAARIRNVPNPFNPRTTIFLDLPGSGRIPVSIDIFDIRGRRIAALFRGELPGGKRSALTWDGRGDAGDPVPSGIYLVRARAGSATFTGKMVLIR